MTAWTPGPIRCRPEPADPLGGFPPQAASRAGSGRATRQGRNPQEPGWAQADERDRDVQGADPAGAVSSQR
jgi:hypothetical protein